MEWVETTGSTIEEAKDRALDELGVDDSEAEFEVVDEPKPGLFGMMRREARVRARVRPVQPRPKVDRRRQRRQRPKDGEAGATRTQGARRTKEASDDTSPSATTEGDGEADTPAKDEGSASTAKGGDTSRGGKAKPSTGGRGRKPRSQKGAVDDSSAARGNGDNPVAQESITLEAQTEVATEFLEGLLDAFEMEAEVSAVELDEDTIELQIEGEELGLLIGQKGRTLSSIQELSRTVVQRRLVGQHDGRFRVDVSGYRKRRQAALERFAAQVAEQVVASGARRVLEPMNAADRKVVHDAINAVEGVTTSSEGEEPRRHVVVLPED